LRGRWLHSPLPWLAALLVLYLVVPVVGLFVHLADTPNKGFGQPGLWGALWTSVLSASIATAIIAVLGIPLAYLWPTTRAGPQARSAWRSCSRSPSRRSSVASSSWPSSARTRRSAVSSVAISRQLGRHRPGADVRRRAVSHRGGAQRLRHGLERLHRRGGDARHGRVRDIPAGLCAHCGSGIAAGLLLAWLRAFGEFGANVILAYHPFTLPVYAYTQFAGSGLTFTLAPAALAVAVAAVFLALLRFRPPTRRVRVDVPAAMAPPPRRTSELTFALERRVGSFHLTAATSTPCRGAALLGASGAGKTTALRCLAGPARSLPPG